MADIQGQLVLAQNQYAFVQDSTKGTVQVYAGPHASALSNTERPVNYNKEADIFEQVDLREAIKQNPLVAEGDYIVLTNPAFKGIALHTPESGVQKSNVEIQIGRKVNIPGPATFPLWPGQSAETISGHHMRSNQYLIIRVYNAEEAKKNLPSFIEVDGDALTNGQQLVVKGTEVSFFIPPNGFEVLQDPERTNGNGFIREALTLERLEYCILLDEDGNKRYERGPKVVFPEATERYWVKAENSDQPGQSDGNRKTRKFKAIELNDQMGLYVKVIADYLSPVSVTPVDGKENAVYMGKDGRELVILSVTKEMAQQMELPEKSVGTLQAFARYKTGEELFITGKEQRIYYPKAEHALIEYQDPKTKFNRQRYYGIAIPKGEGRYILDKNDGDVKQVKGPRIFLPDPRNEVIVRRVLDDKTVSLWYPGNSEALEFNRNLRSLVEQSGGNYVTDALARSSLDLTRGINRGTSQSKSLVSTQSFEGDKIGRGGSFTQPPTLTLDTKYDGVPAINVYTGYAVRVVNKSGDRRVEIGPCTVLLQYDETLEKLELSTGKPKSTDHLKYDVYLRVDNNLVSDVIKAETKDLVEVEIKVSYRIDFLRDYSDKWFSVENYVKFVCDHLRSVLKGVIKQRNVKDVIENSTAIVRDAVLGEKGDSGKRGKLFEENGMFVYDVEVLGTDIADEDISEILHTAQREAVQSAITLASEQQALENTREKVKIQTETAELETSLEVRRQELKQTSDRAKAATSLAVLQSEIESAVAKISAEVAKQEKLDTIAASENQRTKSKEAIVLDAEEKRVALFEKKMASISDKLIQAMITLGETEFQAKLTEAIAPLALAEGQGLNQTLERIFQGTPVATVLENIKTRAAASSTK
jgi:major vault protein